MATFAGESGNLKATIRELAPTLAERQRGLHLAQRRLPAHARVRPRGPAEACKRDAGHDRRGVPLDHPDPQAGVQAGARRAGRGAVAGHVGSGEAGRPPPRSCCRKPTWRPSACATSSCRPATSSSTTASTTAPRTTRSCSRWWASPARPEHRRQRHVRALPPTGSGAPGPGLARLGRSPAAASSSATTRETPLENQRAYPGKRPPYNPTFPCYKNALPDVNGPAAAISALGTSTTQRVSTPQDRLRRQADLEAVRAKLNPFARKSGLEATK